MVSIKTSEVKIMAFWNKIHNPNVHPLSRTVVDETAKILYEHGVFDQVKQAKCALALFQATVRNLKQHSKNRMDDATLLKQSTEMKAIVKKFGIESEDEQEEIVLAYMEIVGKLGE